MVPSNKWIRGYRNGRVVVDARQYVFVWEVLYWPWWFFARDDIDGELVPSSAPPPTKGVLDGVVLYDLIVDGQTLEGVARGYPDHPELQDLVTIQFDALDRWFEEDVEVFVHPRSPYTRVDALASSRHVVVSIDGVVLANSRKPTVLFETGAPARYYLPMTDVHLERLTQNTRRSSCPYKGDSTFFDAHIGDRIATDIAWTYVLPRAEAIGVAGLICFYNEKVDIDVDGEREARPRTHFS